MNRFSRVTLTVSALSLGLVLAGCETFDPTSILDAEIFNTKKKLPGERQAVFPEGTPGVSQGVPQEMVKGYQPPTEPEPPAKQAEPKPKPKPKPKVVAAAERGIGPDRGHRPAVQRHRRKASGPIRRGSSQRAVAAAGRGPDSRRVRSPGPIRRAADCAHPRQRA